MQPHRLLEPSAPAVGDRTLARGLTMDIKLQVRVPSATAVGESGRPPRRPEGYRGPLVLRLRRKVTSAVGERLPIWRSRPPRPMRCAGGTFGPWLCLGETLQPGRLTRHNDELIIEKDELNRTLRPEFFCELNGELNRKVLSLDPPTSYKAEAFARRCFKGASVASRACDVAALLVVPVLRKASVQERASPAAGASCSSIQIGERPAGEQRVPHDAAEVGFGRVSGSETKLLAVVGGDRFGRCRVVPEFQNELWVEAKRSVFNVTRRRAAS